MIQLSKKHLFLFFILLLFIACASGTQFDSDGNDKTVIVDPPSEISGERIPVFLIMSDQPTGTASVQTMKATAESQQEMAMSTLAAIDPKTAETAQSYWIVNAIRVEADPADLDRLASLPGVDHIEHDYTVSVTDPPVETMDEISPDSITYSTEEGGVVWSANFIDAPSVWKTGNLGTGINISIVDTGIDVCHPAFGDRIVAWADFVGGDNTTPYDDNGHGTHCAGTSAGGLVETTYYGDSIDVVLGVAPGANLMGAKVLDSTGNGHTSDVINGVQWSVDNGADIISMSLGTFLGPWDDDFTSEKIVGTLNASSSVDVSIEAASSHDINLEPQFIVGAVSADSPAIDEIINGENLTFTVTDADGNNAKGSMIDWLGCDTPDDVYYFRASYADNAGAWNGNWKATLTNEGNESISINKIRIAVCYQSNGCDVESEMVNNLMSLDTTVVVSAGNKGSFGHGTIGTPGVAEDVITVGATDYMMDYWASFSSMGPVNSSDPYIKPDIMAPGVGIISAYKNGRYAILDGTSMSTPAVAGTAALMLAGNSSLSSKDIKNALMSSAVHIDENGAILDAMDKNSVYGAGRVNAYEAVNITNGLGNTPIGNGVIYELYGGSLSAGYNVYGDDLPVTAVAWNVTGGVPMPGEEVKFSVWKDSYNPPYDYVNKTVVTNPSGNALTSLDISGYEHPISLKLRIAWKDHVIEQGLYKTVPPEDSVSDADLISTSNDYAAMSDDTVCIKYPVLNPDGTAYTDDLNLKIGNYSAEIYNETITPIAGVVAIDLNLSTIEGVVNGSYSIWLDEKDFGSLDIGYENYLWYELWTTPEKAICSPGSSIDISTMLTTGHCENVASTTATATVVTFSETQINSLAAETRNLVFGGEITSLADLETEIQGMDVGTLVENFQINSGIGVYNLTMPKDAYLAMVYFETPLTREEYNEAAELASIIYGDMTPWLEHSTTKSSLQNPFNERTYIFKTSSEWPATWDQDAYKSIPSEVASVGYAVYNFTFDESTNLWTGRASEDQTVYLYTRDGVKNATTDAQGRCSFTLRPGNTGDEGYECLAVTGGLAIETDIYNGAYPLSPEEYSRIRADLITLKAYAPSDHFRLRPDTATRTISVTADNEIRNIKITSIGPNDESIQEKGMFALDQMADSYGCYSYGTFDASTIDFDGTFSKSVEVPGKGTYWAEYRLLNPVEGRLQYTGTIFTDTSYNLTYKIMDDVLQGESVPVTFTLTDQSGNPISGAKILFNLGGATTEGQKYGLSGSKDPRYENIWTYLGCYPDPYSRVLTGYTDTNGRLTLTFTAPTFDEQEYRLELGSYSQVNYAVACTHDDDFISRSYGYFMPVAGKLPDFKPDVDAPNVVKINRDDTVCVNGLGLYVTNVGTADFVYTGTDLPLVAEVGSYSKKVTFKYDVKMDETEDVLFTNIEQSASDYGIDPETTSLPQDTTVKVTVNPEPRVIEELRYDNNVYNHNLRITAPDLVTEIISPSSTTQFTETPIGVKVTNAGEVASVPTTMSYDITGAPAETGIAITALEPGESTVVWRNKTLSAGNYEITAVVNPSHLTDYETSYTNNAGNKDVVSYAQTETSIVLPSDVVYIPGTSVEIPIIVEDVTDLAAYQMTFSYNSSVITVKNVVSGDIALTGKNLQDGHVIFNGAQTSGKSGSVTVATLVIDVIGSSGDETPLGLSAELWEINDFTIPVDVSEGSATLLLYGDANSDGTVNQLDTLKVLKWVVGIDADKPTTGTRLLQTDVTQNGHVDVGDGMFIAQHNAELRDDYFNIR